jgi:putative phage-type endonuclease
MIKISNTPQGTEEWLSERRGFMTGSNASAIGNNGTGLETYCKQVVMELYCNSLDFYTNKDMERGNELEPEARTMYQLTTGNVVKEVGFITNDKYERAGVSLDGYGEKNIEIKCMNNKNHFQFILERKIKPSWIWQMQMGMLVSEKQACDFIAYNPNFDDSIIVVEVPANEAMFEKLRIGLQEGNKIIQRIIKQYEQRKK